MPDLNSLTNIVGEYGYLAVFCTMFLEGMCIPIPSELIMGFAGFMVYQGKFSLGGAIAAGWLGSLSGSFTVYLVARKGGRKFLYRWGHLIHLGPERLDIIGDWFNRYGPPLIIPWRQLPVIRTKISIAAGLLDMRYIVFTAYTAIGIAVWCSSGGVARLLFRPELGNAARYFQRARPPHHHRHLGRGCGGGGVLLYRRRNN